MQATDRIELNRALEAPRWSLRDFESDAIGSLVYRPGGNYRLTPIQFAALTAIYVAGGAFLMIGVGHGKTLIAMLACLVLASKRPLIMVPAGLTEGLENERAKFEPHFNIPDFGVLKYSELQTPQASLWLEGYQPDLIVCDEAHKLKNQTRARTRRVLEYLGANPGCRFVVMSGTVTHESPRDFAHLCEGAFGDFSPMPRAGRTLDAWHAMISPKGKPVFGDHEYVKPLIAQYPHARQSGNSTRQHAQSALFAHLAWSRGVVATVESSARCTIILRPLETPAMPSPVLEAIQRCRDTHENPRGIPFIDENEELRCIRQLESGFYYWTDFGSAPATLVDEWKRARSEWMRALAHEVQTASVPGCDSPALITARVESGAADDYMIRTLRRWRAVEKQCSPFVRAEWISPYLLEDAIARQHFDPEPSILWFKYRAQGEWLRKWGHTVYAEGVTPPEDKAHHCAMSIRAHGVGRNLQVWRRNRILNMPADGAVCEQLFGRTHRLGQTADEVIFEVYQNTPGAILAMRRARESAEYIERTTGQTQKLRIATIVKGEIDNG